MLRIYLMNKKKAGAGVRRAGLQGFFGVALAVVFALPPGDGGLLTASGVPTGTGTGLNATLASGRGPAPASELSHLRNQAAPCGYLRGRPKVDQVMLVWEENHAYSSIIGNPAAPEINRLASECGLATNYYSIGHPSLPNYLAMTSGLPYASWPWTTDCDPQGGCVTGAASIFSELAEKGRQWRSYAESMGASCGLASYGTYAAKHNPAVYYTMARADCRRWDQPMGTPSRGALRAELRRGPTVALTTLSPNVDDDMHDGTVGQADSWLASWLPQVVSSPAYRSGRLAVVVVWDEGTGSGATEQSHVPLVVMSASTPRGARSAAFLDDYSVLHVICQLTGVPQLNQAARAPSFVSSFHL